MGGYASNQKRFLRNFFKWLYNNMLYVCYGDDRNALKNKAQSIIDDLRNGGGMPVFRFDNETLTLGELEEFVFGKRLFEGRSIIVLDGVFQKEEIKNFVFKNLKAVEESENVFIFIEDRLDAPSVAKIKKHTKNIFVFKKANEKKKDDFSVFSLADGLGERNKKKLWVSLERARMTGIAPEEIHGVLFWQVKSMLLALGAQSADTAGLNPFVFGKSKRFAKNYTKKEIEEVSARLVDIYHIARRGGTELDTALERFVLML